MGFEAMTSTNPSAAGPFEENINSPRKLREKRLMTTEEFDRILQTEPPTRLSLVSNRRGSVSNNPSEKARVGQHPARKSLKKQVSFDNFSHKLKHSSVDSPPRSALPHFNSYAQLSTTHPAETMADLDSHNYPGSDTEANSDTSSTGATLMVAEKKSISSLIKKTFGKKSKRSGDKDATTSSEQSLPSSPSASLFSISPQPSPVDSIFDHSKATLDSLRGQHPQRYQLQAYEEDWEDNRPPPIPTNRPHGPAMNRHQYDSAASTPFRLSPAPKAGMARKGGSPARLPLRDQPLETPKGIKVSFQSEEEVIQHADKDDCEEQISGPRSRTSSFSSEDSFHTIEEMSMSMAQQLPLTSDLPRHPTDAAQQDLESLRWENSMLSKELEKIKKQLALEQSARSSLLKSMDNARTQFDDISAQAYRKLRQVTSENRRLHSQVNSLERKLTSLNRDWH
ncbi:hypothetical protein K493DRAFT_309041 [Basidiobolus meristosporus CBS 931.73]|uniref:Uncharacterized protein n=1 Tax=Basidiobolus meristosporus CBS 931.73 TaxID=1314790 RepID=A0A1Y1WS15_9FUNG|nr:hypothetical protein K493DRAFT_309041 [Basidiobolus meristosporus CBS 931.73]|eukprot:ORX76341.1 hypothetical protein K493DRAFT_309041 [Basidiobolus meristosporus CBS 931.73]